MNWQVGGLEHGHPDCRILTSSKWLIVITSLKVFIVNVMKIVECWQHMSLIAKNLKAYWPFLGVLCISGVLQELAQSRSDSWIFYSKFWWMGIAILHWILHSSLLSPIFIQSMWRYVTTWNVQKNCDSANSKFAQQPCFALNESRTSSSKF